MPIVETGNEESNSRSRDGEGEGQEGGSELVANAFTLLKAPTKSDLARKRKVHVNPWKDASFECF